MRDAGTEVGKSLGIETGIPGEAANILAICWPSEAARSSNPVGMGGALALTSGHNPHRPSTPGEPEDGIDRGSGSGRAAVGRSGS